MTQFFQISDELLGLYRERAFSADFWAEPLNALTNASFLIAAFFAWNLASARRVTCRTTYGLLAIAGTIGFGSFFFHTVPTRFTMWLDVIPISSFQLLFLWLISNRMLGLNRVTSAAIVVGVVGSSFAFFPTQRVLNGSLFYLPSLVAMLVIGHVWSKKSNSEPYLLIGAGFCFLMAVTARSIDHEVPWRIGTHFLWHSVNGVVVYMVLRTWIVFAASSHRTDLADSPQRSLGEKNDPGLTV